MFHGGFPLAQEFLAQAQIGQIHHRALVYLEHGAEGSGGLFIALELEQADAQQVAVFLHVRAQGHGIAQGRQGPFPVAGQRGDIAFVKGGQTLGVVFRLQGAGLGEKVAGFFKTLRAQGQHGAEKGRKCAPG